jgi:hypothetical protein
VPLDALIGLFAGSPSDEEGHRANAMARMARMGRIYKLLRLMRLVKLFKILKNKENLSAHFTMKMKISQGTERLIGAAAAFLFFIHIFTCLFMLLGTFTSEKERDCWINSKGIKDMGVWERYTYTAYFIVTTMTTVGYGD